MCEITLINFDVKEFAEWSDKIFSNIFNFSFETISGLLINKLKSEFILENGTLNLNKYEAYGPDIGFSNQGTVYLNDKKINLEGAIIPMVTLNKIIGSIPVVGKILTNERKGIWSFVYTITGDLDEPEVKVNPIKTITPGFIQKFFSVFKTEKKEKKD